MIHKTTLDFLKKLKTNNNREWFAKNKSMYEAANENVKEFTGQLLKALEKTDSSLKNLEVKDCLMRIYRDVRFSKNKDPYKTNFGIWICRGGKKMPYVGYYVHIAPGSSFIAGGLHMPEPDILKKVRQEVFYNIPEFKKIIGNKKFKDAFGTLWKDDMLKLTPAGYEKEHPDIEWVKYKSYIVTRDLKDKNLTDSKLISEINAAFKLVRPFNDFLNRALLD